MSAETSDENPKSGFLPEEQGAVTVDFAVLAGGIIALTIGISASVLNSSLSLASDASDVMASINIGAPSGGSGGTGGGTDGEAGDATDDTDQDGQAGDATDGADQDGEPEAPPAAGNPGNDKPVGNASPVPQGQSGSGAGNPGNSKPVGNAGSLPSVRSGSGIGNRGNDEPVGQAGDDPSGRAGSGRG